MGYRDDVIDSRFFGKMGVWFIHYTHLYPPVSTCTHLLKSESCHIQPGTWNLTSTPFWVTFFLFSV